MNISFHEVTQHQSDFLNYVRTENIEALRNMKSLGKIISPQRMYREAFYIALHQNLLKSMEHLLKHPHFYHQLMYNEGVIDASISENESMFDLLYPLSDRIEVHRMMREDGLDIEKHNSMEAHRLQKLIANSISENDGTPKQRVFKI